VDVKPGADHKFNGAGAPADAGQPMVLALAETLALTLALTWPVRRPVDGPLPRIAAPARLG